MKKLLLASTIAAISLSNAQAAPTIYGKAFLTVDATNTEATYTSGNVQTSEDVNESGLNSNSSRIGFKGSEALTADMDVVYKLEYGIDIDDNKKDKQFKSRDTYLGVAHKQYGTLLAGRLTSIDDDIFYTDVLEGSNIADIGPTFNGERLDNAMAYISPEYNGMVFKAEYALDSDTDSGSLVNEDQYGVSVEYTAMPNINVGASYVGYGDINHVRIAGEYEYNQDMTVAALYQMSDLDTDDNENTFMLSGEMATATPWSYYGKVTLIDNVDGNSDSESMGVGIGGKYKFTKASTGHLYAGYVDSEREEVEYEGVTYDTGDTDGFGIGGGLEYKF